MNLIKRKQDEVSQPKPKKYMRRGEKEALSKGAVKDADSDEEEQPETGTTDTRTASERRRDDTMKQREKEEDEKEQIFKAALKSYNQKCESEHLLFIEEVKRKKARSSMFYMDRLD